MEPSAKATIHTGTVKAVVVCSTAPVASAVSSTLSIDKETETKPIAAPQHCAPPKAVQRQVITLDSDSDDDSIGLLPMPARSANKAATQVKQAAKGNDGVKGKVSKRPASKKGKTANTGTKKAPRATRKRARDCARCRECSCKKPEQKSAFCIMQRSNNDADKEKHLIKQKKIKEQELEKRESDLAGIERELKKIRRSIWRKKEESGRSEARFLADGKEMDGQMDSVPTNLLLTKQVAKACGQVFGEQSMSPFPTVARISSPALDVTNDNFYFSQQLRSPL